MSLLLIVSCGEDTVATKYGSISGSVINGLDSTIITNVEISTSPATTVLATDKDGKFFISNVVGGEYTINASKIGYQKKSIKINVIEDKTTKLSFLLFPNDSTKDTTETTDTSEVNDKIYARTSLLCYYSFNDNYKDISINHLDGVNSNTSIEKSGQNTYIRLYGNQNSYVLMDYPQKFNLNEFTYSFWINPTSDFGTEYQDFIDVISRWGHWGPGYQSFTFAINKKGSFRSILFDTYSQYSYTDTKNVIYPNVWTHVAISYSNKIIKIFINGKFKENYSSVIPTSSTQYGIKIGARYDSPYNSSYNGYFDDLTVFSEALSDNLINDLYELQKVNK